MKLPTGIEKLDEMLSGGIGPNSSNLILTDPMVDKASFAQQILSTRLADGDKGIYVTTSKLPSMIIKNMYDHGWETKNITFVDCISFTLGVKTGEKYALKRKTLEVGAAWEETMKIFEQALKEVKGFKFAVFDCLETFMGVGADKIAEKLNELKTLMKETRTTCLYLLTNWNYKEKDIKKIRNAVDCVIELGTVEKKLLWMNYFFVDQKPKVFFVITDTGVNLYVPKILITGPFHAGKSSIAKVLSEKAISVDRLGTTVALDHGYVEKKGLVCDIFGTPGQ
ncbi:hypothetical protein DRN32_07680, partial [Thermococci archaeon]